MRIVGGLLFEELAAIARDWPTVFDPPRGHGLMLGLPVKATHQAGAFVAPALDDGLLINAAGRNTLRFVPPLIITSDEVRDAMVRLRRTIARVLAAQ